MADEKIKESQEEKEKRENEKEAEEQKKKGMTVSEIGVGYVRRFSKSANPYTVREILKEPSITMNHTWGDGICPHCKGKLSQTVNHRFTAIEILGLADVPDDQLTFEKIMIIGQTYDRLTLALDAEKYNEVFAASENFKQLKK